MDTEKRGLAAVLGSLNVTSFLRTSWEREAQLLGGAAAPLVGRLFTIEDFERLACGGDTDLSVVQEGRARPVVPHHSDRAPGRDVLSAYRSGATLLLSLLARRCSLVGELCRGIEFDLLELGALPSEPVGANAYLTPPRAQGFDHHHDDHSVLVAQLHGSKRWEVFAPGSQQSEALVSATLEPGDVLSVPHGFPHVAYTADEASLHLTLGLHTLSWADAKADMLRAHEPFRRSVTGPEALASALPHLHRIRQRVRARAADLPRRYSAPRRAAPARRRPRGEGGVLHTRGAASGRSALRRRRADPDPRAAQPLPAGRERCGTGAVRPGRGRRGGPDCGLDSGRPHTSGRSCRTDPRPVPGPGQRTFGRPSPGLDAPAGTPHRCRVRRPRRT
ncbi:JmjC domain-containing protein [Streptomyces sp. NPDC058200]|uniref:JmjC domain-containing protein n=1 Tax=Streptomyces sp. NPDC058200 TaxID=3346378 RepID=UPI0036EEE49F